MDLKTIAKDLENDCKAYRVGWNKVIDLGRHIFLDGKKIKTIVNGRPVKWSPTIDDLIAEDWISYQ